MLVDNKKRRLTQDTMMIEMLRSIEMARLNTKKLVVLGTRMNFVRLNMASHISLNNLASFDCSFS